MRKRNTCSRKRLSSYEPGGLDSVGESATRPWLHLHSCTAQAARRLLQPPTEDNKLA